MKKGHEVLAAGLLTFVVCACSNAPTEKVRQPVKVRSEEVKGVSADATHSRTYVGIVEENEATAVSFTGMGVVRRMMVSEGQKVREGDLIAEMDDTQAKNMLTAAEAAMSQADDALKRYGMLHDNGSLSEVQWVEVQSKVAQARSQLEIARKNVSDCRLTAPVDGIVGRRIIRAGETALPSQAVVTILDVSRVKVKVAIPEGEMNKIGETTTTKIHVEAAQMDVQGGRIEKGVKADAATHTYDIRIAVSNADGRLLPGMVAKVEMPISEEPEQIVIPMSAVCRRMSGEHFVWTIDADKRTHRTPVVIGKTIGNSIAIESGLSVGSRIVTEGTGKIGEGSEVIY